MATIRTCVHSSISYICLISYTMSKSSIFFFKVIGFYLKTALCRNDVVSSIRIHWLLCQEFPGSFLFFCLAHFYPYVWRHMMAFCVIQDIVTITMDGSGKIIELKWADFDLFMSEIKKLLWFPVGRLFHSVVKRLRVVISPELVHSTIMKRKENMVL